MIVWIGRLFRSRSLDETLLTLFLTIIVPVHMEYIPNKSCKHSLCFVIPLEVKLGAWIHYVCPVCPWSIMSTLQHLQFWMDFFPHLAQMITNMRGGRRCLACNDFWPSLTLIYMYIFKVIHPWPCNKNLKYCTSCHVCSVTSAVLDHI